MDLWEGRRAYVYVTLSVAVQGCTRRTRGIYQSGLAVDMHFNNVTAIRHGQKSAGGDHHVIIVYFVSLELNRPMDHC